MRITKFAERRQMAEFVGLKKSWVDTDCRFDQNRINDTATRAYF
jgi:hypothetical protein